MNRGRWPILLADSGSRTNDTCSRRYRFPARARLRRPRRARRAHSRNSSRSPPGWRGRECRRERGAARVSHRGHMRRRRFPQASGFASPRRGHRARTTRALRLRGRVGARAGGSEEPRGTRIAGAPTPRCAPVRGSLGPLLDERAASPVAPAVGIEAPRAGASGSCVLRASAARRGRPVTQLRLLDTQHGEEEGIHISSLRDAFTECRAKAVSRAVGGSQIDGLL